LLLSLWTSVSPHEEVDHPGVRHDGLHRSVEIGLADMAHPRSAVWHGEFAFMR
jgi:hypothetical protein